MSKFVDNETPVGVPSDEEVCIDRHIAIIMVKRWDHV